jgi:[CysO sulfur-carrier protein]-S-L-cysteine hydrolase
MPYSIGIGINFYPALTLVIFLPRLTIRPVLLDKLVNFAEDALPLESCALLLGEEKQPDCTVVDVFFVSNQDQSMTSFSVDPSDLFCAYQHARKLGLSVVGVFHSHPSLPQPSQKDKKFMRLNPIIWLIYSTLSHTFSAFLHSGIVIHIQISLITGGGVRHPWGITQPP